MRIIPDNLLEDIKTAVAEVGYGSVEVILNGPDGRVDVIRHERTRYPLDKTEKYNKPDKFHLG